MVARSPIEPSMLKTPSVTTQICPVTSLLAFALASASASEPGPVSTLLR